MNNKGKGALSGAFGGAGTGFGVGGPIGAGVGAILGAGVGLLTAENDPNVSPLPPLVDPNEQKMLDELRLRQRSIELGTSSEFQTGRELIGRAEATALNSVQKMTGGDVGGAVAAANQVVEGAGVNISKMVGQATQLSAPYTQMIGELVNRMSQRRLELGMADRLQGLATQAQNKEDLNANITSILSSPAALSGVMQGLGKIKNGIGGIEWGNNKPLTNYATPNVWGDATQQSIDASLQSHYGLDGNDYEEVMIMKR